MKFTFTIKKWFARPRRLPAGPGFLARAAVLFLLLVLPLRASPPTEYQLKAAFLYKFARFVTWPESSLAKSSTPLVIGILGPDPFGPVLEQVLNGKEVFGHPVQLCKYATPDLARRCHVLFIGERNPRRLGQVFEALRGSNALTVGDGLEFTRKGGMIGFYLQDDRVRIAINLGAVSRARLIISSQLIKVSTLVKE